MTLDQTMNAAMVGFAAIGVCLVIVAFYGVLIWGILYLVGKYLHRKRERKAWNTPKGSSQDASGCFHDYSFTDTAGTYQCIHCGHEKVLGNVQ